MSQNVLLPKDDEIVELSSSPRADDLAVYFAGKLWQQLELWKDPESSEFPGVVKWVRMMMGGPISYEYLVEVYIDAGRIYREEMAIRQEEAEYASL